jgi:hypothetical protein
MTLNRFYIFRFQVFFFLYSIVVIIFGIIAFTAGRDITNDSVTSVWNELSEVSKSYFNDDIGLLVLENQRNFQ